MKRWEAIKQITSNTGKSAVILCNGMISRETSFLQNSPRNFYMIGSMGLASSIALGLALEKRKIKVVIIEGDGNFLMNLGILAMIAAMQPQNLLHIVLDNGSYDSTGGQRSISSSLSLEVFAKSAGYLSASIVEDITTLSSTIQELMGADGPAFLLVKIESGSLADIPRIKLKPEEISSQFRKAINKSVD